MSDDSAKRVALRHLIRNNLGRLTTSVLVLGATAVAPALAQQAGASGAQGQQGEELSEITVTGIRASLASAQAIKQNTDQLVDSITAIDIGRLPDVNIAETLQRISGIQISRNFGEGSGIAIRGLTQVRSELNGRDIFSANGGRGLSWEEVGSDLLAGVDVYKNPSAELVEGGLGGTINLRTRKPFDAPGQVFSATGGYNRYDLVDDDGKFGSALYSNRWEVGGGDIGVLVNLSYGDTAFRRDRAVVEPFWERTDVPGFIGQDNIFVNAGGGLGVGAGSRERKGRAVALQWAPSENAEYYAQYLRADYQIDDVQYSWFAFGPNQSGGNLNPVDGTFTFDENGNLLTGTLRNPPTNSNTGGNRRNSMTSDYAIGAKWKLGDRLTLGTDVQYVEADTYVESLILYTALLNNTMLPGAGGQEWFFHMDLTGDFPRYRITPDNYAADIDNYFYQAIQEHRELNDADSLAARVDLTWEFEEEGFLNDLRTGVRYTDKSAINRSSSWGHWGGVGSCESWSSINNCFRMASAPDHAQLSPFQHDFLRGEGRNSVIGPNYAWRFSDSQNPLQAFSFVNTLLLGQNNAPYTGFNELDDPSSTISNIDEQTSAAYVMLRFGSEIGGRAWDGNLGVRYVRTESAANAFATFNYRDPSFVPDPMNPGASPQVISSGRLPIVAENSYDHVLPSLNLRLHATDKIQVRFAASKNVTRPDFGQLNGDFNVTPTYAGGAGDVTPEALSTANVPGNPALKPMQVTQFDTSVEWYFSDVGYVYGTVFHKKLKDLFFTATDLVTFEFPELGPLDFQVSHLTNLEEGKLKGFEVGGQRFFDFLPAPWDGLGIQANYTYVDSNATTIAASDITAGSSIEVPVQGLSKNSYNFVLLFDKYDFNVRLAYNWRDDWVETTSGNGTGALPIFARPFGQLDGSVSYDFNDAFALTLDAVNILDSHHRTYQGVSGRDRDYQVDDRRIGMRFRVRF
jgi:iron complex outermembrane recepter protein